MSKKRVLKEVSFEGLNEMYSWWLEFKSPLSVLAIITIVILGLTVMFIAMFAVTIVIQTIQQFPKVLDD